MKRSVLAIAAASALAAITFSSAQAMPRAELPSHAGALPIEQTQFVYGGRQYCFYPAGWRGPGYYYCGFAWRRGLGWGGPVGWRGWGGPRRDFDRPIVRGPRFDGGYRDRDRGGFRGGRHDGGRGGRDGGGDGRGRN